MNSWGLCTHTRHVAITAATFSNSADLLGLTTAVALGWPVSAWVACVRLGLDFFTPL